MTDHHEKIARLTFASVYPHYVQKVQKKGRTIEELHEIIRWLTGFSDEKILQLISDKVNFVCFFEEANLHPNAIMIRGTICGYRIEEIDNELTKKVRYLDKIVDELAKGKSVDKICRKTIP